MQHRHRIFMVWNDVVMVSIPQGLIGFVITQTRVTRILGGVSSLIIVERKVGGSKLSVVSSLVFVEGNVGGSKLSVLET